MSVMNESFAISLEVQPAIQWIQSMRTKVQVNEHTVSSFGNTPSVLADLTINGHASVSFQIPARVSPTTCPIRRIVAGTPAVSAAAATMRSATSFERAYPDDRA